MLTSPIRTSRIVEIIYLFDLVNLTWSSEVVLRRTRLKGQAGYYFRMVGVRIGKVKNMIDPSRKDSKEQSVYILTRFCFYQFIAVVTTLHAARCVVKPLLIVATVD